MSRINIRKLRTEYAVFNLGISRIVRKMESYSAEMMTSYRHPLSLGQSIYSRVTVLRNAGAGFGRRHQSLTDLVQSLPLSCWLFLLLASVACDILRYLDKEAVSRRSRGPTDFNTITGPEDDATKEEIIQALMKTWRTRLLMDSEPISSHLPRTKSMGEQFLGRVSGFDLWNHGEPTSRRTTLTNNPTLSRVRIFWAALPFSLDFSLRSKRLPVGSLEPLHRAKPG
ncbi:hypothetical protein V8F33_013151 [Rhypophila sp. PSN 637]